MKYLFILLSLLMVAPVQAKKIVKKPAEPIVVYVEKPIMKLYEDGVINISYSSEDGFDYQLKNNAVVVTVIQQGSKWIAVVYDPMQDKTYKVSRLEVIPTPKLKWYQRLFK